MSLKKASLVAAAIAVTLPMGAGASSHREAPNIALLPGADSTDFYLFNSYEANRPAGYVTILANYIPLQHPYGGPNYFAMDPNVLYEIHIDNDGDARENLTYQFRFQNRLDNDNRGQRLMVGANSVAIPLKNKGPVSSTDLSNLNFRESYTLTVVNGDRRTGAATPVTNAQGGLEFGKPLDNIGTKTFSGQSYRDYANTFIHTMNLPNCNMPARVFVGQRREGFAVNLGPVFDLVNFIPVEGDSDPGVGDGDGFPGGITQSNSNNITRFSNVTTLALEVHASCLTGSGNGVIGGWTSASMKQGRLLNPVASYAVPKVDGGPWIQVSRLGMPLVNELGIGLVDKDRFSASEPRFDGQFLTYVTNPTLPALLDALFRVPVNQTLGANFTNIAPTNLPRQDLVATLLTGFPTVNQLARVTPSEMTRLNTTTPPVPAAQQSTFGVAGGDLAGFPNGRRPGDDTVDIALRVFMGRLCHPIMLGGNSVDLGLCTDTQAPLGMVKFTDGAPLSAADFDSTFPYLVTPLPGAGG